MTCKWIGAVLVILGCGGFGFLLAAAHKMEEQSLRNLIRILDHMECELQYRLTPLPDLCRSAGETSKGTLRTVFLGLAGELEAQIRPDVQSCMTSSLAAADIHGPTRQMLTLLGASLGRFDLAGQLKGLESVRTACRGELEELTRNRDARLRGYQTLGLCAGAALAILFI